MNEIIEALKAVLFGIVEGITEWLPISSTGHMMLLDEFVTLNVSEAFYATFLVVIQLGAILAVIILYFNKLNPFSFKKTPQERRNTWGIWMRVVIGSIPAALVGLVLDDWMEENIMNSPNGYVVVSCSLIAYGIVFIILERFNRKREQHTRQRLEAIEDQNIQTYLNAQEQGNAVAWQGYRMVESPHADHSASQAVAPTPSASKQAASIPHGKHTKQAVAERMREQRIKQTLAQNPESKLSRQHSLITDEDVHNSIFKVNSFSEMSFVKAFIIGIFQSLAVIPGTSRSGSIIIGSMIVGTSREVATEFAFFLAIPIMFGWSFIKLIKHGLAFSSFEWVILAIGMVVAFVVSIISIKFLVGYVKKNDFTVFGWYRIVLGVLVLAYFGLRAFGVF